MKRILTTLLSSIILIVLATSATADTKIVERSAKKTPDWLGAATEGYIVATVRSSSLAEAQKTALTEITDRIIRAVASNVTVAQKNTMNETNTNGSIDSRDEFSYTSTIRAAGLPFLKGISLSNAADIYWVKLRDKKTGQEYYDYSVKYPFSSLEQKRLISEFETLDADKEARLRDLENGIANIESTDEIKSSISQLEALEKYFFDDVRLAQAKALRLRYKDLYKSLTLKTMKENRGTLVCCVMLNGRALRCPTPLKAESSCAVITGNTQNADGRYIVSYDTRDCLADEENTITLSARIGGQKVSATVFIGNDELAGETDIRR